MLVATMPRCVMLIARPVTAGRTGGAMTYPTVPERVPAGATPEGDGVVIGAGPVRVDAFIDFLCPFCRQFELSSESALAALVADQLASLVYHPMSQGHGLPPIWLVSTSLVIPYDSLTLPRTAAVRFQAPGRSPPASGGGRGCPHGRYPAAGPRRP